MSKKDPAMSSRLDTPSVVAEFVLQMCAQLGAAVEEIEWGIYDVLWPTGELERVTFDVEVAQERPECELVTFGTPWFEHIQKASRQQGQLQVRRLPPAASGVPGQLDEKIRDLVYFVKCRPPRATSWSAGEGCAVLYRFHVTYQMADLVEEIVPVLIDAGSLADITHLLPSLDFHEFETAVMGAGQDESAAGIGEQPGGSPLSGPLRLPDSYRQAVNAVSIRIDQRLAELKNEYQAQRQQELDQSRQYFQTILNTLRQQMQNTADAARAERLSQKIAATEADWEHRRDDIARAYDVSADAVLDQTILYLVPVVRISVLAQQRTEQLPFVLDYYPWAKAWAPVVCPACHAATRNLHHDDGGWHCGCLSRPS